MCLYLCKHGLLRILTACVALSLCAVSAGAQTPNWKTFSPPVAPAARYLHAMAYDVSRQQVVLFGGLDATSTAYGDTWIWNGTTWARQTPANAPPPRFGHRMAYDPVRREVILFGGWSNTLGPQIALQDTWAWDGQTWLNRTAAASPPPRSLHSMAYDAATGQIVMFGGVDGTPRSDTWFWDGTSWVTSPLPAPPPPARYGQAMAYDSLRGNIVMFGGTDSSGAPVSDTWEWNGASWTKRFPIHAPSPREGAILNFDTGRGESVLFGGRLEAGIGVVDTWTWDGVDWTLRADIRSAPVARAMSAGTFDEAHGQVVVFGGISGNSAVLSDTWAWPDFSGEPQSPVFDVSPQGVLRAFSVPCNGTQDATLFFASVDRVPLSGGTVLDRQRCVDGAMQFGAVDLAAKLGDYPAFLAYYHLPLYIGVKETTAYVFAPYPLLANLQGAWNFYNGGVYDLTDWTFRTLAGGGQFTFDGSVWRNDEALQTGALTVRSNLAAASFTLAGPATYAGSGAALSIPNAPPGVYTLTYNSVRCYVTPPPQTLILSPGDSKEFAEGRYGGNATLRVGVSPNEANGASFAISPSISGLTTRGPYPVVATGVEPVSYTVRFDPLVGFQTPQSQERAPDDVCNITFSGLYLPTVESGKALLTVGTNRAGGRFTIVDTGTKKPLTGATNVASFGPTLVKADRSYQITYLNTPGYYTPPAQTVRPRAGLSVRLSGVYRRLIVATFTGWNNAPAFNGLCPVAGSGVNYPDLSAQAGMIKLLADIQTDKQLVTGAVLAGFTFYGTDSKGVQQGDSCTAPTGEPDHLEASTWVGAVAPSADDLLVIAGHSYGGFRAELFVNQLRRQYQRTADLLIAVDPIDWSLCSIALHLGGCDQEDLSRGTNARSALSFHQTNGIAKGLSFDLLGYTLDQDPSPTLVDNKYHITIDDADSVHTAILGRLKDLTLGRLVIHQSDGGSRDIFGSVTVPIRVQAMSFGASDITLVSATLSGVSAMNLGSVAQVGDVSDYSDSSTVSLQFPVNKNLTGTVGTLTVRGTYSYGQSFTATATVSFPSGLFR